MHKEKDKVNAAHEKLIRPMEPRAPENIVENVIPEDEIEQK